MHPPYQWNDTRNYAILKINDFGNICLPYCEHEQKSHCACVTYTQYIPNTKIHIKAVLHGEILLDNIWTLLC